MGCYLARPITDKEIENVEKKGIGQKFVSYVKKIPLDYNCYYLDYDNKLTTKVQGMVITFKVQQVG